MEQPHQPTTPGKEKHVVIAETPSLYAHDFEVRVLLSRSPRKLIGSGTVLRGRQRGSRIFICVFPFLEGADH